MSKKKEQNERKDVVEYPESFWKTLETCHQVAMMHAKGTDAMEINDDHLAIMEKKPSFRGIKRAEDAISQVKASFFLFDEKGKYSKEAAENYKVFRRKLEYLKDEVKKKEEAEEKKDGQKG